MNILAVRLVLTIYAFKEYFLRYNLNVAGVLHLFAHHQA